MAGLRSPSDETDIFSLYSQHTESGPSTPTKTHAIPPVVSPFRRARSVTRRNPGHLDNELAKTTINALSAVPDEGESIRSRVAPMSANAIPSTPPPKRVSLADPGVSSPSPGRSAKDLISQWESMSPRASTFDQQQPISITATIQTPPRPSTKNLPPPPSNPPDKKRSPLRQSFRNILSVFGKKPKNKPTGVVNSTSDDPFVARFPSSETSSETALRSGSVLYFCNSSGPAWTPCTAGLYPTHILLQGDSTTKISLSGCTDVRSVSLKELDSKEVDSLPRGEGGDENPDGPKVFEVVFGPKGENGERTHRFAVRTVKDRAWWVSGIWDMITNAQEKTMRARTKAELVNDLHIDTLTANAPPPSSSAPSSSDAPKETNSRFSLGPLTNPYSAFVPSSPTSKTPTRSHDGLPAPPQSQPFAQPSASPTTKSYLSPSTVPRPSYKRTDTSSTADTTNTTSSLSSRSPSILDLGHRSVVRQRLAAMRNGQPPPPPSTAHTRSSPRAQNFSGGSDSGTLSPSWQSRGRSSQSKEYSDTGTALTTPATSRAPSECGSTKMNITKSTLSGATLAVQNDDFGSSTLKRRPASYCAVDDYMDALHGGLDEDDEDQHGHGRSASRLTTPAQSIIDYYSDGPTTSPVFDSEMTGARDNGSTSTGTESGALRSNIQDIASGLDLLLSDSEHQTSDLSNLRGVTATLTSQLTSLHSKSDETRGNLLAQGENHGAKVNEVKRVVEGLKAMIEEGRKGGEEDTKELKGMVEEVRSRLKELPVLLGVVETGDDMSIEGGKEIVTMGNLSPFRRGKDKELPADPGRAGGGATLDQEQLQNIVGMLEQEKEQRETQMAQQADSVRYLQELNTWLETFVNTGTAQIQTVAAGVHQLCSDLGHPLTLPSSLPTPFDPENPDSQSTSIGGYPTANEGMENRPPTLIEDLRELLAQTRDRQENERGVMDGVGELIGTLREDMAKSAEMRDAFSLESVFALMSRQKQEQEGMLQSIAAELSNEIRGERLRFIEAMKEATAINIGVHVQEFKKELTREVMLMTQEVSRLQRERQAMEQQIADLFAFYGRQKAQIMVPGHPPPPQQQQYLVPPPPPKGRY